MVTRIPIVSGQFYSSGFEELDKQIIGCFNSKLGPGDLPIERNEKKITYGIVSPHAGYQISGPSMAWAYKELAESKFPSRFIILGTNHTGLGESQVGVTLADWETPFGQVKCDKGFARELIGKCDFIKEDDKVHANEHSIEVQLPFLQVACKDKLDSIRIVPIIVSSDYEKVSSLIFDAIRKLNRDVVVIASSDFTHYGPNYGYVPFTNDIKESLYALDKKAIEFILKLDSSGFLDYIENKGATICGKYPIAATIELSKKLGATSGSLLRYYTSGDVSEDYSSAVGYGAIKIK